VTNTTPARVPEEAGTTSVKRQVRADAASIPKVTLYEDNERAAPNAGPADKPLHLWDNPQRIDLPDAVVKLAELHLEAARHNPQPVDPERAAAFRARMSMVDPVTALARIHKALEPEIDDDFVKRTGESWDAWEAERDPHKKALLQMRLGVCVAGLLGISRRRKRRPTATRRHRSRLVLARPQLAHPSRTSRCASRARSGHSRARTVTTTSCG
jgi:hypothetical protein